MTAFHVLFEVLQLDFLRLDVFSPAASLGGSAARPSGVRPGRLLFWSPSEVSFNLYLGECLFYVLCRGVVADHLVCHAAAAGGGQPRTPGEGALRRAGQSAASFRSYLRGPLSGPLR